MGPGCASASRVSVEGSADESMFLHRQSGDNAQSANGGARSLTPRNLLECLLVGHRIHSVHDQLHLRLDR
jgi:hypothetical protein